MTDPIRWSDAGDSASEIERSLVQSAQSLQMPSSDRLAVWSRIAAALPSSGAPTPQIERSTAIPSVMRSTPLLRIGKTLSVVALASGLSILGYRASHHSSEIAPSTVAASSSAASTRESPVSPLVAGIAEPSAVNDEPRAAAAARARPSVTASPYVSQLQEESQALLMARQALRSNEPAKALRLLEQAQARFRPGMLLEERSALLIEALARSGNTQGAAARAEAFLRSYPKSPHVVDVRKHLAP